MVAIYGLLVMRELDLECRFIQAPTIRREAPCMLLSIGSQLWTRNATIMRYMQGIAFSG